MLQLPVTSLEHSVKQAVEENPFLEEFNDMIDEDDVLDLVMDINAPAPDQLKESKIEFDDKLYKNKSDTNELDGDKESGDFSYSSSSMGDSSNENYSEQDKVDHFDEDDNYDYYDDRWEDDADYTPRALTDSDKDFESFQIKNETTLYDLLAEQINIFDLSAEEELIAFYIIGNIDDDGYLRRDISDMLSEINSIISKHNYEMQVRQYEEVERLANDKNINPAKKYELNSQSMQMLLTAVENNKDVLKNIATSNVNSGSSHKILKQITTEDIDRIIRKIQMLDPAGIASRNIQECLIAQLKVKNKLNENEKIALMILTDCFDEFSKKHFINIQKKLFITENQVKEAFEEIKKLNPKPGGVASITQNISIIPDFIVKYDEKTDDFTINLNDTNVPTLKVSKVYEKMLIEARKSKEYNKSTREWMKERYENAKFFIQAMHQRSITMLMVMTAIVHRQRKFFLNDVKSLKPMIYQDISNDTSLDISTICRVVNDKYVQTSSGIYELKFLFSDSLLSFDGEEIATKVIRSRLKEIILAEPKNKPYTDDQLTVLLQKEGYNIARRTVAKYRETLKLPIARLRKEI